MTRTTDRELAAAAEAMTHFGWVTPTFTAVPSFSHAVLQVRFGSHVGFLKRYPSAMARRVKATVGLAERVSSLGLAAHTFWRTTSGDVCAHVSDALFTLSRCIGERTLLQGPNGGPYQSVARFLARLHEALAVTGEVPAELAEPPHMWNHVDIVPRLERLRIEFRRSREPLCSGFYAATDVLSEYACAVSTLSSTTGSSRLLHGDFWPGNLVRTGPQDEDLGIVDFDDAFRGQSLLDVAQFADIAHARFSNGVKLGLDLAKAAHFACQYAVEARLPAESLEALPDVLTAARVCSAVWIMERHVANGPGPLDALLNNDIQTIKYVSNTKNEWLDLLMRERAEV